MAAPLIVSISFFYNFAGKLLFFFLLSSNTSQPDAKTKEFWVNMPNLMTHLKKVAEQKPQATYYNVDMLKYQVSGYLDIWFVRLNSCIYHIYL